jgi:hypothetical protein
MQNELFPPDQVAQMVLSGIEFIALFSSFIIAGVLLIWSGLAIWVGHSERRQRRGRQ